MAKTKVKRVKKRRVTRHRGGYGIMPRLFGSNADRSTTYQILERLTKDEYYRFLPFCFNGIMALHDINGKITIYDQVSISINTGDPEFINKRQLLLNSYLSNNLGKDWPYDTPFNTYVKQQLNVWLQQHDINKGDILKRQPLYPRQN